MNKVDTLVSNDPAMDPMMGSIGGMMGNPMGATMPQATIDEGVIDADATVLDEDGNAVEEIKAPKNPLIAAITPLTIVTNTSSDNKNVATLTYLCKDKENKLFIVNRNFILTSKDDIEIINTLPFTEDKDTDFASKIIANHMIMSCLDSYITDMIFTVDDDFNSNPDPILHMNAVNVHTKMNQVIDITAEAFSCMSYIDSYIYEDLLNEHDLVLASVAGSKIPENPTTFFVVDNVESIVAMAPAVPAKKGFDKFKSLFSKSDKVNTVGMIVKFNRFTSATEKETISILCPINVDQEFPESKYRGKTIEDIENTYFADGDQYVSTFIVSSIRLMGVDKEYMLIRGKTKDKKTRIFLLDAACQEDLDHKIEEF